MELEEVDFGNHGIIYVTQEKEKPRERERVSITAEWPNSATEELLKILKKHYQMNGHSEKFGTKRILYENCSMAMRKKGYKYAPTQCENKWKSLKRRYLTMHNRSRAGKNRKRSSPKRLPFDDEIEYVLQFDKPIKKELDDDTKSNIILTQGYDEDMDQEEYNNESEEIEEKEYTQSDEQLVQMMLKGSDDEDHKEIVYTETNQYSPPPPQQKQAEASVATPISSNGLLKEVANLTKTMRSNVEANTNLLKSHSVTYEQILVCLDSLDKKADEKIEIERKKLEKQGELLQQKKIQNSLLAKIIQRMGNNITSSGSK